MIRYLYFVLFVIALGAIVYALGSAAGGPSFGSKLERFAIDDLQRLDFDQSGTPAPADSFWDTDGSAVTLADFEGQTILVNFWATWCGPCEREMPHLGTLAATRGGETFKVVAISVDAKEDEDYARRRLEELTGGTLAFYSAPPEAWDIVYATGARGFPTTIIYGADGTEVARLSGEADWSEGVPLAFVDEVLSLQSAEATP